MGLNLVFWNLFAPMFQTICGLRPRESASVALVSAVIYIIYNVYMCVLCDVSATWLLYSLKVWFAGYMSSKVSVNVQNVRCCTFVAAHEANFSTTLLQSRVTRII